MGVPVAFFSNRFVGSLATFKGAIITSSLLGGSISQFESSRVSSQPTPLLWQPHVCFHLETFIGSTLILQALLFHHRVVVRHLRNDRSAFRTRMSPSQEAHAVVFQHLLSIFRPSLVISSSSTWSPCPSTVLFGYSTLCCPSLIYGLNVSCGYLDSHRQGQFTLPFNAVLKT